MTVLIHYPSAMPKRRSPAAPIIVSAIGVKYEPTAFHFRVAQRLAAQTRHFTFIQRQIHVLGSIAVQVVHLQLALARGKIAGRVSVRATPCPAPAIATRSLRAPCRADTGFVGWSVTPGLRWGISLVVQGAHAVNRFFGSQS